MNQECWESQIIIIQDRLRNLMDREIVFRDYVCASNQMAVKHLLWCLRRRSENVTNKIRRKWERWHGQPHTLSTNQLSSFILSPCISGGQRSLCLPINEPASNVLLHQTFRIQREKKEGSASCWCERLIEFGFVLSADARNVFFPQKSPVRVSPGANCSPL